MFVMRMVLLLLVLSGAIVDAAHESEKAAARGESVESNVQALRGGQTLNLTVSREVVLLLMCHRRPR